MLTYQDALFADGVQAGERACDERWSLIEPFLPRRGVVLDVGSNLGYFAVRAAQLSSEVAVLSLESSRDIAARQREVLESHQLSRVCLLEGELDAATVRAWRETCDWVDCVLLLSVLHWVDDPASVVADLSAMSGRMIIEVPDVEDTGACGQDKLLDWADPVAWFERVTGRSCRHIGRASRHTSGTPSHLILVEGPVSRSVQQAYWGCTRPHPQGRDYRLDHDGTDVRLTIRGTVHDYEPGLNLHNLMHLGRLVSPPAEHFLEQARAALALVPGHGDPLPHNLIWSASGLTAIDGTDLWAGATPREVDRILRDAVRRWQRGPVGATGLLERGRRQLSRRRLREATAKVVKRCLPDAYVSRVRTWRRRRAGLATVD